MRTISTNSRPFTAATIALCCANGLWAGWPRAFLPVFLSLPGMPSAYWLVQYHARIQADSKGQISLMFTNNSPTNAGDHTIFLDNVAISELPNCGANAKCFDREVGRYMCECDAGFLGTPSANAPASCTAVANHVDANDLAREMERLADRVQTLEQENSRLQLRADELELLSKATKAALDEVTGTSGLPSLEAALANLTGSVDALNNAPNLLQVLKQSLKTATATLPQFSANGRGDG